MTSDKNIAQCMADLVLSLAASEIDQLANAAALAEIAAAVAELDARLASVEAKLNTPQGES